MHADQKEENRLKFKDNPVDTAFCSLFISLSCSIPGGKKKEWYGKTESYVSDNLRCTHISHFCAVKEIVSASPLPSRHLQLILMI
jgi:hypothetical protein